MATTMSLQTPASAMPPPPRRQSNSSNSQPTATAQSPNLGGSQTIGGNKGAGEDVAEEDNDDEADGSASGMDATITDQVFTSLAASEFGDEDSIPDDLEQKIFELQASGWRPPEEMVESTEDEDYNAVDLLSDNEEEDGHLRRREEQLLTAEDRFNPTDEQALARRLSLSSQGSNDSDLAYLEFNDNFLFSSETPWSQSFQHLHPDNLVDYGTVFDDTNAPGQDTPLARKTSPDSAQRRVRFEDEAPSDTDDSDSEIDQDLFPDLFVQQDQLDAGFRADIEADVHDLYMDDESETGSCWDFDADEARILMMDDDDDDGSLDSDDSSVGSSGYESDDGDTTDDEEVELPPEKLKQAAQKAETDVASNGSTPKPSNSQKMVRRVKSRTPSEPKRGEFILDPYKPILTVDCEKGKADKIRIWPARKPTSQDKAFWRTYYNIQSENTSRAASRTSSPRMSMSMPPTEDSDSNAPSRHMSIDSSNLIDGFFDESGRLLADQVLGPMEAFLPFMDVNASGIMQDDSFPDAYQAMPGAEEEQDPISSFVDFGEDSDEDMPDESDNLMSPTTSQSFSNMNDQASSKSNGFDLLAHLDRRRGMVGSFRRNQQIAKHVGSLPSHPALRASASESNAMQTGRRAAANTPITPLRKKKGGKGVGARNSPMTTTSPVTKSPPLKRKGPAKGGFSR